MKPVRHRSNTRTLNAPDGWDQNGLPVDPLGVTDEEIEGVHCVVSFWEPDADERAAIAAGGLVGLSVVGHRMPPVLLLTLDPDDAAIPAGKPEQLASPTAGMTLGERIAHVGGRTNAQGYTEFGSVMAVGALLRHFLRDLRTDAKFISTPKEDA